MVNPSARTILRHPTRKGPRILSHIQFSLDLDSSAMSQRDIPSIDLSERPDPKDVSAAISDLGFLFVTNATTPSQDITKSVARSLNGRLR